MTSATTTVQEFIATLVRGRDVLDVGCVGQNCSLEATSTWLHKDIVANAASVIGVDILRRGIAQLAEKGYRVVCADATSVELPNTFEVIVAAEILEHLDNPGQFLSNMRRHLAPGGILILTTPNVFYALHFLESIVASPFRRWNAEHACWYCSFTLENVLKRNGMQLCNCLYFARSRKIRSLLGLFRLPVPKILASTIVAVAKVMPQDQNLT